MNERLRGRRILLGQAAGVIGWAAGQGLPPQVRAQTPSEPVVRLAVAEAALQLASGGWVLMMRHEQTVPGVGDPPGFRLDACATQRNLSEAGRLRARRAGEVMRAAQALPAVVLAGRWCRVRETAQLAFGGFDTWTALDSFFGHAERAGTHRESVIAFARRFAGPGNAMLVTHQVNITAVLEVYPEMGEVIAARVEQGALRARLRFNPGSA